jgi:hypothetical protein
MDSLNNKGDQGSLVDVLKTFVGYYIANLYHPDLLFLMTKFEYFAKAMQYIHKQ